MCQVVSPETLLLLNIYLSLSNPASIIQNLVKCISTCIEINILFVCLILIMLAFPSHQSFGIKQILSNFWLELCWQHSHQHLRHYSTAVHVGWSLLFRKTSKPFATYLPLDNNLHRYHFKKSKFHSLKLYFTYYWRQTSLICYLLVSTYLN